jgi:surface protein
MFSYSGFNRDISGLDTSMVTNMSSMFSYSGFTNSGQLLAPTIGGWDTANVTSMRSMFSDNVAFNLDVSGWDTSKVTDMSWMFKGAKTFNNGGQPFLVAEGRWSTAQITATSGMGYMFFDSFAFKQDLSGWPITFSGTPTSFGMLQGGIKPVWH